MASRRKEIYPEEGVVYDDESSVREERRRDEGWRDEEYYRQDRYERNDMRQEQPPDTAVQWAHRRRMAYISLISIIVVTAFVLSPFSPIERIGVVSEMISWFYFAMVSVVGAYMGFKSWSTRR